MVSYVAFVLSWFLISSVGASGGMCFVIVAAWESSLISVLSDFIDYFIIYMYISLSPDSHRQICPIYCCGHMGGRS